MPYYRALSKLAAGSHTINRGAIFPAHYLRPEVLAALDGRHISRISAPPLAEVPGWSRRAQKLADAGIFEAEQFLDAVDNGELSSLFAPAQLTRWQNELLNWLTPPQKKG